MSRHVVRIASPEHRRRAHEIVARAPEGYVVEIRAPRRTLDQNALLWALLTEVSIAKPGGRTHTPEVWKCLFMAACGHAVAFETGLDGRPFPVGFRSSKLTKAQMSDLIEFVHAWCAEQGLVLSDALARAGEAA
jgi:hypothetical protein